MSAGEADSDLVGIGFGPANLALAVALEEQAHPVTIRRCFLEAQPHFAWHEAMLLPEARMQIAFLKDLATAHNPRSRFTFLAYLHEVGRIRGFINQKCFYPTRREFQDYLRWAAARVASTVHYGRCVSHIEPIMSRDGRIGRLRVVATDASGQSSVLSARSLVVATGGAPQVPEVFRAVAGSAQLVHSARYLDRIPRLVTPPARIAVIGAGQSAAEVFIDLHTRFPKARLDLLHRGLALRVADDSPFVNEIFEPAMVDLLQGQDEASRLQFLADFRHTNYAAIDKPLLHRLSGLLYEQQIGGEEARLRICPRRVVLEASVVEGGILLDSRDSWTGAHERRAYDLVLLATGYDRQGWKRLLEPLAPFLPTMVVDRTYRLAFAPELLAPIFVQGGAEATHGLGDSLLSYLPERAMTILSALVRSMEEASSQASALPTRKLA